MQIYVVQYITILEPVYKDTRLLVYKKEIYKSQEENK
jgi:hypothetical protein